MWQSRTFWLGDVESWMTSAYILDLFAPIAVVSKVKIVREWRHSRYVYCAFIEFASHSSATEAFESLGGNTVLSKDGRRFRVKWACDEVPSVEGWRGNQHNTWYSWEAGHSNRWSKNEHECDVYSDRHKRKGDMHGSQSNETSLLETSRWAYIDPKDEIQLGFSTDEMRQWYEGGYFPEDFLVALVKDPTKMKAPPRREFYALRQWFRDVSQAFTYVPRF